MKLINTAKIPSLVVGTKVNKGSKVKVVFSDGQADYTVAAVVTKVNKVTFEVKLTDGMTVGNVPMLIFGSKVKIVFSDGQADYTVAALVTKVNKVTFEAKLVKA